ncbi:MAG: DUF421 domain-containing protein [Firmicutes bacterium]|nr:DUF421 domain-containing protein [Bacillota bacterium]
MLAIVLRTILIYFIMLAVVRLMGKREIGQLSPFDFVVAIMMAELAVLPMESPDIPLWHGIIPLVILVCLEIGISYMALHSHTVRGFLDGKPQIIIENGRILKKEMRKSRYNLNDLMAQLREKGVPNIEDVEFGILETSGRLSIIPRSQKRPITPADLGIQTKYEGMPLALVMDGVVMHTNLDMCGLNEKWLFEKLNETGMALADIFLAMLDTQGELYVVPKDNFKDNFHVQKKKE